MGELYPLPQTPLMATSSVNLLGQIVTVTANVSADPTSNKNMGALQAVLFQYYGLIYLGGQFSPPQVTLQLQDTNNPQLSALSVVGAVSDALAASIGDPGSNITAALPLAPSPNIALVSTSTFPPGAINPTQTGSSFWSNVGQGTGAVIGGGLGVFGALALGLGPIGIIGLALAGLFAGLVLAGGLSGISSNPGSGILGGIQTALAGALQQINDTLKKLFSDLQTGAIVVLVAIAAIAILIVVAKS